VSDEPLDVFLDELGVWLKLVHGLELLHRPEEVPQQHDGWQEVWLVAGLGGPRDADRAVIPIIFKLPEEGAEPDLKAIAMMIAAGRERLLTFIGAEAGPCSWTSEENREKIEEAIARDEYHLATALIEQTPLGPEILASLKADLEKARS
jgi:hypothetical protein